MTAQQRRPAHSVAPETPPRRRAEQRAQHPLLTLQRQAGNAAVTGAVRRRADGAGAGGVVQRELEMTGPGADVKAALALLRKASGLALTVGKKHVVKVSGKAQPPKSAALAARLTAILDDTGRTAKVKFGNDPDVSFGAFPTSADDPVQRLRIADFLALEKAVPGDGVAKLAHEIVENFEAQAQKDLHWEVAFEVSHKAALQAENTVLAELQAAYGESPSGDRWNTYPVSLKTPAPKGKKAGGTRVMHIEVHANDYVVTEPGAGAKGGPKITRVNPSSVGTWSVGGFGAKSAALPKGAAATLAAVAKELDADPTASVFIRACSDKSAAAAAVRWADLVQEGITDRMTTSDVIVKSWRRFHLADPIAGAKNAVQIIVRKPTKL